MCKPEPDVLEVILVVHSNSEKAFVAFFRVERTENLMNEAKDFHRAGSRLQTSGRKQSKNNWMLMVVEVNVE